MAKKLFCILYLFAFFIGKLYAQSDANKTAVEMQVNKMKPKSISWRRHFHQHPELGNREFKTAKIIADHLRSIGLEVKEGVAHTGVVGILMSVAEILASKKNELQGTVKFIFQPAEEGPPIGEEGGAELMIKEGIMENPKVDVMFGLHINAQTPVGQL